MIKRYIEPFAKYAGLITLCFEWLAVALFFVIRPSEFSGERTLSYFASLPETRIIFSICITLAATSFWIFIRYHLHKFYAVPVRLFALSMLGYAVMALTPYDPSSLVSESLHRGLAMLFSLTFLGGIYLIGKNTKDTHVRKVSYGAAALSGLLLVVFLLMQFFAVPAAKFLIMPFEAISAIIGQAWVIWISLHSFKLSAKGERA